MAYPSTRYSGLVVFANATNTPTNADALPTVTLEVDGAPDTSGTVVTVTSAETGRYRISYPLGAFKPGNQILEICKFSVNGNAVITLGGSYIIPRDVSTSFGSAAG